MALSSYALTTLEKAREMIPGLAGESEEDSKLELLINKLTGWFELYTRRRLASRTYKPSGAVAPEQNLLLHGNDRLTATRFQLPYWPVTAVTAITTKYADLLVANQTVLVDGQDWTFTNEGLIVLIDGDVFPLGVNNLELTWTAGYTSGDEEWAVLEGALIEQLKHEWYKLGRASDGVQAISDGGGSVTYLDKALLSQVRLALDQFRPAGMAVV